MPRIASEGNGAANSGQASLHQPQHSIQSLTDVHRDFSQVISECVKLKIKTNHNNGSSDCPCSYITTPDFPLSLEASSRCPSSMLITPLDALCNDFWLTGILHHI